MRNFKSLTHYLNTTARSRMQFS